MHKALQFIVPALALVAGLFLYSGYKQYGNYDVETVSGEKFAWKDKQNQWVIVNFFAQWCAPCLREIPEINSFYAIMDTDTAIYMVSYDPLSKQLLQDLIGKHTIQVPVIMTNDTTRLPMAYPNGLPATYLLNPKGEVVRTLMGEIKSETLVEALAEAKVEFEQG